MRYGTWIVLYTDDTTQGGTTPPNLLGIFFYNATETEIAGYLPADTVVSELSAWSIVELNEDAFLALGKTVNPLCHMDANGYIVFPPPVIG